MICSRCHQGYDLLCANITLKSFNSLDLHRKNSWTCAECYSKLPKVDNSNTPVRANTRQVDSESDKVDLSSSERCNITMRTKKQRSQSDKECGDSYVTEDNLRKIIRQDITEVITELVSQKLASLTNQISGFQESLQFLSKQYDDLIKAVNEKEATICNLEARNSDLTTQVKSLSDRLSQVEQHMRSNNLEINGIPEHRSENLTKTLEQLSIVVENPLCENDILHVTRIAKINKENNRPRSVLVKLRSQRRRDELLAAVIRYNKKNKNDKLNSDLLGIGGTRVPVFVAEHLTPNNKYLHAAARIKAKEMGYKFVWVRDGRVLVRRDEQSPAIVIKDTECLKLLK